MLHFEKGWVGEKDGWKEQVLEEENHINHKKSLLEVVLTDVRKAKCSH